MPAYIDLRQDKLKNWVAVNAHPIDALPIRIRNRKDTVQPTDELPIVVFHHTNWDAAGIATDPKTLHYLSTAQAHSKSYYTATVSELLKVSQHLPEYLVSPLPI